jgi:hypothetical protein
LLLAAVAVPLAAQPRRAVAPERLHPELADSTWGRRMAAAWRLAFARDWSGANQRFGALRAEQPDAVEPLIGLGFVARGAGDPATARNYFRDALALDPTSTDAKTQLDAADWDRPGRGEVGGGAQRFGGATKSTAAAGVVVPLNPVATLTAGGGVLSGGDPLRGIFLDSTGAGTRTTMVSGGAVFTPLFGLTLNARAEYWSGGGKSQTFVWTEAAVRMSSIASIHAGARPVSGENGAARLIGGVDVVPVEHGLLSVDVSQGVHAAPFEARTIVRGFATATPDQRTTLRAALVRDVDPNLSATTGAASIAWLATPTIGFRVDYSQRSGAFAQTSAGVALLFRW